MDLPLAREIKKALIEKEGVLYEGIEIIKYFESTKDRKDISLLMKKHSIPEELLLKNYHDSLKWCVETFP